jgi:predicted XRE-type DNA-binding protein
MIMTTKSYRNVWDALENTPEDAANMKVRAELLIALQNSVHKQKGTQAKKAEMLGLTQPRLNDLLRGRIDKFSLDALVNIADRAGLQVNLKIRRAA